MKILKILIVAIILLITSCNQYVCPAYVSNDEVEQNDS